MPLTPAQLEQLRELLKQQNPEEREQAVIDFIEQNFIPAAKPPIYLYDGKPVKMWWQNE